MPVHHARRRRLVVANARHIPSHGCALRQGREALAFARHKQSSELFVSGLSLDRPLLTHCSDTFEELPSSEFANGAGRQTPVI